MPRRQEPSKRRRRKVRRIIECRRCLREAPHYCRGLCGICYRAPEGSPLPEPRKVYINHREKLPAEPTQARPGSEKKILVLMSRAERGESLHHPNDRKITDREVDLAVLLTPTTEEEEVADE